MKVLLVGGSKSGKSMLAQQLTKKLGKNRPLYYWATMEPTDEEDRARIARHRDERAGWGFATVEQGRDLPAALPQMDPAGAVLFDSVTALLSNEMFGAAIDPSAPERALLELRQVSRYPAHFICVCDQIWHDGGRYDETTEAYQKGLAHLCRSLAKEFDAVAEVTAGIAHMWKGELPL